MYKRIAGLFFTLVILANIFTTKELNASIFDWDANTSSVTEEEFHLNREEASNQIQAMYRGFERPENWIQIYPDFYAGPTLDADGRLIISIIYSGIEKALRHDSIGPLLEAGVQYRFVEFSLTQLQAMQASMWEGACEGNVTARQRRRCCNRCRYESNVTWGYICTTYNRVVVGLYRYNDSMIAGYRRYVYDSPMLMFEQGAWLSLSGGEGTLTLTVFGGAILLVIVVVLAFICFQKPQLAQKQ